MMEWHEVPSDGGELLLLLTGCGRYIQSKMFEH